MVDFILIVVLAAIIGGIILYLYRAKKRGETCIGCPHAKNAADTAAAAVILMQENLIKRYMRIGDAHRSFASPM
ncbi:MAG: FeoB-associated Cys-rich membrane protein [Marvinbryantia sp.]|jgi:cbb3-type cytochrome oxidase subunit 3